MESMPKIGEYMDTVVPTLSPETQIMKAVDFLVRHRVTGAPVVDSDGTLVGIITETDLLKLATEGIRGEPPTDATVAEYMTRDVITVPPTVDIYYIAGMFLANKFRRLPVVENGKIVGAITRFDLLRIVRTLSDLP
jgi:CBS domain-containing protein